MLPDLCALCFLIFSCFLGVKYTQGADSFDVRLKFDHAGAGYFLKPLDNRFRSADSVSRDLIVLEANDVAVSASIGSYKSEHRLDASLVRAAWANTTGSSVTTTGGLLGTGLGLSAHLVANSVTQEIRRLDLLFHAGNQHLVSQSRSWCLRMHVQHNGNEQTETCQLGTLENQQICLVSAILPESWWSNLVTHSARVTYSAYRLRKGQMCLPNAAKAKQRALVSSVTLVHSDYSYEAVKEDNHILVEIPQHRFPPGAKFMIRVKLQAHSDVGVFVVRAKARLGLSIFNVSSVSPLWSMKVEYNTNRRKGAIVTAYIKNRPTYSKQDKIQHIFDWIFRVDDEAHIRKLEVPVGRITLNIEYELSGGVENFDKKSNDVERKVVTRIKYILDEVKAIVPVVKSHVILNTAILSGSPIQLPLEIFSVAYNGIVENVTFQTTCHSGDDTVLKVDRVCRFVYVDGSESRGLSSVSVIAKFAQHTQFIFFRVWAPELPLSIELADAKLSQVKAWKVPRFQNGRHTCSLRYQQTELKVYARFTVHDNSDQSEQHLVNKKALLDVTELVAPRLRTADTSVAILSGHIVEGLKPGRTEVQVLSLIGRVIGAREIVVGSDKVNIQKLLSRVVSGLDMTITGQGVLPGTLKVMVTPRTTLRRQWQEGVLDASVLMSDGSVMFMNDVPANHFRMSGESLKPSAISFVPQNNSSQLSIKAYKQSKGQHLRVKLQLGRLCLKKRSEDLAIGMVYTDVDFLKSISNEFPQRDMQDSHHNQIFEEDLTLASLGSPKGQRLQSGDEVKHRPLEIGMYTLLAVFCVAILVFGINFIVFVIKYRKKHEPIKEVAQNAQNASDWVWIGKETLERNAINTHCQQRLLSDMNTNESNTLSRLHPNGTMTRPGSNRNSLVSTYKGSECSIRITANPMAAPSTPPVPEEPEDNETISASATSSSLSSSSISSSAAPSLSEEEIITPLEVDLPPITPPKPPAVTCRPAESDAEWDYEAMGLDYQQLMEYFDNLKETSA